jgi:hypothetical protein
VIAPPPVVAPPPVAPPPAATAPFSFPPLMGKSFFIGRSWLDMV